MANSEIEISSTPPELTKIAEQAKPNSLPAKSKVLYLLTYSNFSKWKQEKCANSSSESVLLAYFAHLSKKYQPSSLWATYSKLRSTIHINDNIDIKQYHNLQAFLKRHSDGYQPKKAYVSNIFSVFCNLITASGDKV